MFKKITRNLIIPSAAKGITPVLVAGYRYLEKVPVVGDVVYGKIISRGQHGTLENQQGRIHKTYDNTRALFVFGNRYAPDYFEGFVPTAYQDVVDVLSRSGMIGSVKNKKSSIKDPTKIKILGFAVDKHGAVLNTVSHSTIQQPKIQVKRDPRAKLILSIGTSMNSGKSLAAASMCWALSSAGHRVIASKITGTASLKDILLMQDAGAHIHNDFTDFGYPSTYMLGLEELLHIFNTIDLKYCNNKKTYWVVEIADGILQRETAMLLHSDVIRKRIHRVVFSAQDALGALCGVRELESAFNLTPDAISGICSSAPLHVRELQKHTNIPVFNSADTSIKEIMTLINGD